MRTVFCGTSGEEAEGEREWEDLTLERPWTEIIQHLVPDGRPRPIQAQAIKGGVLKSRRHLIASAPTNGGKSLIGHLVLLRAALRGERAILLEPLRVLARDKWEQLQELADALEEITGTRISVRLSTGDYRRENEQIFDGPPDGEIVVATPERLEALARNSENTDWLEKTSAVVVDEAHMIGDGRRGATLEYVVTFLRAISAPPRIALLSATLGDLTPVQEWMEPCDVYSVEERQPPLEKYIVELEEGEDSNEAVLQWVEEALEEEGAQVLVFVYQTRSTESTASFLQDGLGDRAGPAGVRAYHSRMGSGYREEVRDDFMAGRSRVVVTTTGLKMGVNFPASHVIVRDTMFYGANSPRLDVTDLLQMMGRAGRGTQAGTAAVLLKPSSGWSLEALEEGLREEQLPTLTSSLMEGNDRGTGEQGNNVASKVAALLGRWSEEGARQEKLSEFFSESLGGRELAEKVEPALQWLRRSKLAYEEENRFFLTALGEQSVKTMLPLSVAKGWARLIRDLLTIDSEDELLRTWRPLDHILLLEILFRPISSLRRYSQGLEEQVHSWCEQNPSNQPILFREWMIGSEGHSRAEEIFGSLDVELGDSRRDRAEQARRKAYKAMFRTLVIYERSQGKSPEEVARTFGVNKNLEGTEEGWRDTLLWLLSGIAKILDIRSFYYHLRENCEAPPQRVRRVKRVLQNMEHQVFSLQDQLKYLSPLGGALRQMRRVIKNENGTVGIGTIRRLEEQGVTSLQELVGTDEEELEDLGVSPQYADQVRNYLDMRMRR